MSAVKREEARTHEYGEYCEPQEIYRVTQDIYEIEWPSDQEMAEDEKKGTENYGTICK